MQRLGIGTMGQGTSGFSMDAAIADVRANNGVSPIVRSAAGTGAFLPLVQSGELDFGIANVVETAEVVEGKGSFHGLNGHRGQRGMSLNPENSSARLA